MNFGTAVAVLLLSAVVHFACFARWPGNPDWDVQHSVFAAYNFVTSGRLESINLYPDHDENLATHARLRWMTHWPPGHAWLYVAVMAAGLSAGVATKVLAIVSIIIGGVGWIFLARSLGASHLFTVAIGAAYPWLSFVARLYIDYKNDHVAVAMAPWVYLALIRIAPVKLLVGVTWRRLVLAAVMTGMTVAVKYSMMPILVGSALYIVWLDAKSDIRTRLRRAGVYLFFLLLPGTLLWLLNQAWSTPSYPLRPGPGLSLSLPVYAKNIISNTVGAVVGWDLLFIQLRLQTGLNLFRGIIFVTSLAVAVLWFRQFIRAGWAGHEKRFGLLLCLITATLWTMLAVMVTSSGARYDYSSDGRFYMPVGFGWLLLCGLSLDKLSKGRFIRSPGFYSIAIPLIFSMLFFASIGLSREPHVAMPVSRIAWTETNKPEHAAFLTDLISQRGRKPDLLVATSAQFMSEVGVPCFFTYRATSDDGRVYYSSEAIEVWAMVDPSDERSLLAKFRRAADRQRVNTPEGFPFVFYVFRFDPASST